MRLATLVFACLAVMLVGCTGATLAELQVARTGAKPIFIGRIGTTKPNKDGEISAQAQFFNTSRKTYKYVDIVVEAYNRVGDRILRHGDDTPLVNLRFTGPLKPRRSPGKLTWPRIWYVTPITCLAVRRTVVTHMDGTVLTLEGDELKDVLSANIQKKLSLQLNLPP